ncbi:acyl-CoA dehydrogenase family protein [Mucilaginibacter sp. AW1-3]
MDIASHPLQQLRPEWVTAIREQAAAAEKDGKLQHGQLAVAYQQQWFKMLTPTEYGGLELSLPDEVRLIEAISWADGSMGWAITLCTGAGWFGGFLDAGLSREIFADEQVCLAGSGAPGGTAIITGDGYLVSGSWKYASGALHATHFTANCIICDDNGPVLTADGKQTIKAFLFKRNEVNVLPAWSYIGMVATGSHSFEVKNIVVPANRAFIIDPDFAVINRPLYTYPFRQLAEATLAVNLSGLAIHFIDLCKQVFAEKRKIKDLTKANEDTLDEVFAGSVYLLNDIRTTFYLEVDRSWAGYINNDADVIGDSLKAVSQISRHLAKVSRRVVDDLYPYCGLIAASTGSDINRVWRDLHTASQHALLTFES